MVRNPPQKKRCFNMNKAINLATLNATASDAGVMLPYAAQCAIKGKGDMDKAKGAQACALALMVAGFTDDYIATLPWSFGIKANGDVHEHVDCTGTDEFGNDDLGWKRNAQGAISKVAQSTYKAELMNTFFALSSPVPAVWTMASKAIPMARAIREEGMVATIEGGELKLSGGTSERAKAMAEAKSLSALAKVAKGETGSGGNVGQGNGAKGEEGDARVATPAEIMALAARLVEGVAKGEEALGNAALSFARKIAALVAANPEAFAED